MSIPHCSCGFTELADESIIDHLLQVFEPEDAKGGDGQVHEETTRLICSCGFTASTAAELDSHFLAVFTPPDATGRDARRHEANAA